MTPKYAALHSNNSDDIRIHAADCRVVTKRRRGYATSFLKATTLEEAKREALGTRDDLTVSVCRSCTRRVTADNLNTK